MTALPTPPPTFSTPPPTISKPKSCRNRCRRRCWSTSGPTGAGRARPSGRSWKSWPPTTTAHSAWPRSTWTRSSSSPRAFQMRSIPTVFLVKDGQLVDGFPGALPEGQLREFLEASRHRAGRRRSRRSRGRAEAARRSIRTPKWCACATRSRPTPDKDELKLDLALALLQDRRRARSRAAARCPARQPVHRRPRASARARASASPPC